MAAAAQYTNDNGESATLSDFLENMALSSDTDDLGKSGVSLMTIHAAKGCEYPIVFLTGLEQGLFPLSYDEEAKKEEERRLFYVGITRAKRLLFITYAGSRWKFKEREYAVKSEFLNELPKECIKYVSTTQNTGTQQRQRAYSFDDNDNSSNKKTYDISHGAFGQNNKMAVGVQPQKQNAQQSKYNVGDKVSHSRYGNGTIKEIKTSGSVTVLSIQFDDVGMKQFDASLAVLKVLKQ